MNTCTRSWGMVFVGTLALLSVGLLSPNKSNGQPAKAEPDHRAILVIHLPADATLEIQGVEIQMSGAIRRVRTAPLATGKEFPYSLRVSWKDRDQEKVVDREVKVRAGQEQTVVIREPDAVAPTGIPMGDKAEAAECKLGRFLLALHRLEPILGSIGRLQVSSNLRYAITKTDYSHARLWDVAGCRELQEFSGETTVYNGSGQDIFVPTFSPDGMRLAYIKDQGKTVSILDLRTGKDVVVFAAKDPCWCAAFSPDGRHLATGHLFGAVKLYDLEADGKVVFQKKEDGYDGYGNGPQLLSFTSDGKAIVACFRGYPDGPSVIILDSATGKRRNKFSTQGEIKQIFISPDGKRAICRCRDGQPTLSWVMALDLETGAEVPTTELEKSAPVVEALQKELPKTPGLAHCDLGRFYLELKRLQSLTGPFEQLWLDASGRFLITDHGQVKPPKSGKLDRPARESFVRIWDVQKRREVVRLTGFSERSHPTFSPDGHRLIYRAADKTLRLYDSLEGTDLRCLEGRAGEKDHHGKIAFSPDGRYLLSGGYCYLPDKGAFEGWLEHWDLASGKMLRRYSGDPPVSKQAPFHGHIAFAVNGSHFYAAAEDHIAQYEVASGKKVGVFDGHVNQVFGFLLSPDGSRLLSGSADGTVRLWDTKTQKEVHNKDWHTPWVRGVLRTYGDHYVISTGIREIPGPTNSPTRTSSGGSGGGIIVIPQ